MCWNSAEGAVLMLADAAVAVLRCRPAEGHLVHCRRHRDYWLLSSLTEAQLMNNEARFRVPADFECLLYRLSGSIAIAVGQCVAVLKAQSSPQWFCSELQQAYSAVYGVHIVVCMPCSFTALQMLLLHQRLQLRHEVLHISPAVLHPTRC